MISEFEITDEDFQFFLQEAEELLAVLEEGAVRLERTGADPATVQEMFRAAHTIKGSAATVGYRAVAELTHALETVLNEVREGRASVTPALIDVVLEGIDGLRGLLVGVSSLEDMKGEGDVEAAVKKLMSVLDAQETATSAEVTRRESLGITVKFDPSCPMPAVRAYQVIMALEGLGTIISSSPSTEDIEAERVKDTLEVLLETEQGEEAVRQALSEVSDIAEVLLGAREEPSRPAAVPESFSQLTGWTIRVDIKVLDNLMNLVGELVIDRTRLAQVLSEGTSENWQDTVGQLERISSHIGRVATQLQEELMTARMLPVDNLFRKFPRMVRDLARSLGKKVDFVVRGGETELDRSVLQAIGDPLIHILRNAVDHGIEPADERAARGKPETGTVQLSAHHEDNRIIISVRDDGRGIDARTIVESAVRKGLLNPEEADRLDEEDAIDLLFEPGFSTAESVNEISGRGVGLDVVRKNIEKVNGTVEVRSVPGEGTEFVISLPLTLAITNCLLVTVEERVYAIPLTSVRETRRVRPSEIKRITGTTGIVIRNKVLPLVSLSNLLGDEGKPVTDASYAVVVSVGGEELAVTVDSLVGEQEVVIKSLGQYLMNVASITGISGATILGNGRLALILDVHGLVKRWRRAAGATGEARGRGAAAG